jgi:phage protein D
MSSVSYTLRIEGTDAPSSLLRRIRRMELEEHAEMADMLRLEMAIGVREEEGEWAIIDEDPFSEQSHLQLALQVGSGAPRVLLDAYVIETNTSFSTEPGESTLEVVAMDTTVQMNREEKIRTWSGMADSDIAREIFGEYELEPDVTRTQPTERELQRAVIQRRTDAQFLRALAARNGYEFYVETNPETESQEGHFHEPEFEAADQPELRISRGSRANVEAFDTHYDMTRPARADASGVEVKSRDKQNAQVSELSQQVLGTRSTMANTPGKQVLSGSSVARAAELQTYAQAVVDRSSLAVTAEGSLETVTYGDVLRAKRPVEVSGAGTTYSGRYYVQRVLHVITGESYTQQFTLKRNALGVKGG